MKKALALLTFVVLLGQAQLVPADIVVAPGDNAAVEGEISNFYPFAIDIDDPDNDLFNANPLTSQRYQQVYAGSLFGGYTAPLAIERISFRPDSVYGGAFTATLPNIQISLSTTPRTMAELTDVFAENVGSDETIIVNGALTLSSSFTGPAGGPMDFDIHIDLATPFNYDPSLGNLVMDVWNYKGVVDDPPLSMVFDAEWKNPDIYRIYTGYSVSAGGYLDTVNDSTGLFAPGAMGLVTQFTFTPAGVEPVPVPGAALLGVLGLSCAGWRLRRRQA